MKAAMVPLLGRMICIRRNEVHQRDTARAVGDEVVREYVCGACGSVVVQAYVSEGGGDRGGVVIAMEVNDDSSSFFPYAEMHANGVMLHMAGDAEATCLLAALREAIDNVLPVLRRRYDDRLEPEEQGRSWEEGTSVSEKSIWINPAMLALPVVIDVFRERNVRLKFQRDVNRVELDMPRDEAEVVLNAMVAAIGIDDVMKLMRR